MTTPDRPEIDIQLMREYLQSRAQDQAQVEQLRVATERLTSEVAGLNAALATYQAQIDKVRDTAVTKDEADEAHEQMLENLVALRLRIKRRANILFGISIVLILLACGVGAYVLHEQARQRHTACEQRNAGARAGLVFYDSQIAKLKAQPHYDPGLVDLLITARDLSQKSIVKC